MKLKLNGLENPITRAKLRVNAEVVEVAEGEKFLDNKCSIASLTKNGLVQQVKIRCREDDKTTTSTRTISPSVSVKVGTETKEVRLGDVLYDAGGDKRVFLGYIGETKAGKKFIVPVVSAELDSEKFKQSFIYKQLPTLMNVFTSYKKGIIVDTFISTSSSAIILSEAVAQGSYPMGMLGENGEIVDMGFDTATVLSKYATDPIFNALLPDMTFLSFSKPGHVELSGEAKVSYENAKKDYETIRESYSSELFTKDSSYTFGEEALHKQILLAWTANQKAEVVELCREFEQAYPHSAKVIEECNNAAKLASSATENIYVTINGKVKQIFFDGVYEPTIEDYSVEVLVQDAGDYSGTKLLQLHQQAQVSENEYISLKGIGVDPLKGDNSATLSIAGLEEGLAVYKSGYATIELNDYEVIGKNKYKVTLTKINLKKIAKVSVIPNIDSTGTSANFSFKVGIEKRAIQLSPEKIKNIIKNLDSEINQWQGVSNSVGKMVGGLKTGCLATGVTLITKNFLLGTGGKGIARQSVMRGENGWNERCVDLVNKGTYSSQEQCYNKNANEIDKEVDELYKIIDEQNSDIKDLEKGITTTEFLGEEAVDTDKFMARYIPEVSECVENLPDTISDPSGKGTAINKNDIADVLTEEAYKKRIFTLDELREIDLYCRAGSNKDLQDITAQRLYSSLLDVKTNSKNFAGITTFAGGLGVSSDDITFIETEEKVKKY
ncbi:hypothetical protein KY308_03005, partial [Candidatus Woesearchaeota archaeon]|nr:hypothetical protein [Candidatus Woesearchaeota archaeon]